MDSSIQEIKKRIDIVDFIGSFVPLKKAGRNYNANCPFHSEKTPSFVVSPDRQIWRCFGACQDGGDVISFLQKWENLTFFEAVQELAKQAGVKLKNLNFEDKAWTQKEKLLKINSLAAKYFHYILIEHASGAPGREYLKKRQISDALAGTFTLGYAPKSWDSLLTFLAKKKYTKEDIFKTGLIIKNDSGRYYDRFRGRLMFPIIDARSNILGFSGRLLHDSEKQAKYVNTPETLIYHKRETLFGMHVAHDAIRKAKSAILVEGEFDMISSFKHGIKNTVAVKGSAVTGDQLMLLKRYTKHIILALDADFSGTETTLRAIKDAEDMDFRIDVVQFDFGKDPDEALQNNPAQYKKIISKPTPLYDFIIGTALHKYNEKDPYEKRDIAALVLPFIRNISNPIVKGHYIKRLADLLELDETDIHSMLRKMKFSDNSKSTGIPERKADAKDRHEMIQMFILASIFQSDKPLEKCKKACQVLEPDDFTIPAYNEIFKRFSEYLQKNPDEKTHKKFDMNSFIENFDSPLQHALDDLFVFDIKEVADPDKEQKSFNRTLYELKRLSLKDAIKKALKESDKSSRTKVLTDQLAQVEKELGVL